MVSPTIPPSLQPPQRASTMREIREASRPPQQEEAQQIILNEEEIQRIKAENARIDYLNKPLEAYNETIERHGLGVSSARIMHKFRLDPTQKKIYLGLVTEQARVVDKINKRDNRLRIQEGRDFSIKKPKELQKKEVQTNKESSPELELITGKGANLVSLPESTFSKYKGYVKREGIMGGSLGFVGAKASALESRGQDIGVKKFGGRYDPQMSSLFGGAVQSSAYLIPGAGSALFVASGTENLVRYDKEVQSYKDQGFEDTTAKALALGVPVGEIVLGTYGLRSDIKSSILKQNIKKAETQFFADVTKQKDLLKTETVARTTIGKNPLYTRATTYTNKKGQSITEGLLYSRKPPSVKRIQSIGSSQKAQAEITEKVISGQPGIIDLSVKLPKTPGVASTSISRVGADPKFRKTFSIGSIEPIKNKEGFFYFRGGEPKTLRLYKKGKITVTGDVKTKGIIRTQKQEPKTLEVIGGIRTEPPRLRPTKEKERIKETVEQTMGGLVGGIKKSELAKVDKTFRTPGIFTGRPTRTTTKTKTKQRTEQLNTLDFFSSSAIAEETKTKTTQASKTNTIGSLVFSGLGTLTDTSQITGQGQITGSRTKSPTKTRTTTPTITNTFGTPETPTRTGGGIGSFFFPGERRQSQRVEQTSYDAYYLRDSTKNLKRKWVKINETPQSRSSALDLMARVVDKTPSAKGRIVAKPKTKLQTKKRPSGNVLSMFGGGGFSKTPQLPKGDGYFNRNRYKFRESKIRKGQPKTTPNQFIEKRPFRIDSPGEKRGLQASKMSSLLFGGSPKSKRTKPRKFSL